MKYKSFSFYIFHKFTSLNVKKFWSEDHFNQFYDILHQVNGIVLLTVKIPLENIYKCPIDGLVMLR